MILYVRTTADKYELPIAVADSIEELAEMLKIKRHTVQVNFSKKISHWYKVEVEDDIWM